MEADDLQSQAEQPDAAGERFIADRLDALEAERVMLRALELEADSLDSPNMISADQLERIAKEIGVDSAFVRQALGEIRLEPKQRSRFARWVLPQDLVETATLSGLDRADLDASITKWLTQNEGLTPGGELDGGVEWNVDRRWRARALSSTLQGGNRISRVAGGDIAHRVHSVSEDEHVVAFESEGRAPLLLAKTVMAVGAFVSSVLLLGAAGAGDWLAGLLVFGGINAGAGGLGVAGARWWARGIRGALRRSLMGLRGAAKPRSKGWLSRLRKKP